LALNASEATVDYYAKSGNVPASKAIVEQLYLRGDPVQQFYMDEYKHAVSSQSATTFFGVWNDTMDEQLDQIIDADADDQLAMLHSLALTFDEEMERKRSDGTLYQ
jgi:hypothetical protein